MTAPAPASALADAMPIAATALPQSIVGRPLRDAVLGVPLAVKIAGAVALALAISAGALVAHGGLAAGAVALIAGAVLVALGASNALVAVALEPLRELEKVAGEILQGNLKARVRLSPLADAEMRRVSALVNSLVDAVVRDREHMRELAVRVVSAQDDERARIARELQDSTAQRLAALQYELSADLERAMSRDTRRRLELHRAMIADALEDLRAVTNHVHPRILTDFGLVPALEWLARSATRNTGVSVLLQAPITRREIRPVIAGALYRVAQEAVNCACQGDAVKRVSLSLTHDSAEGVIRLVIASESDPAGCEAVPTLGVLRERVSLVGGAVTVRPRRSGGTIVEAIVPSEGA